MADNPINPIPGDPRVTDELLAQYLSGQCTAEEAAVVDQWAAADRAHARVFDTVRAAWHAGSARATYDTRAGWRAVAEQLQLSDTPHHQETTRRPTPQRAGPDAGRRDLSVAQPWPQRGNGSMRKSVVRATLVATAVASVVGVLWLAPSTTSQRWFVRDRSTAVREYVTSAGQRETVTLADGTELTLAPVSRLRVPVTYNRGARDVELEGEAYFAVTHNAAHPFAVHVGHVTATDVGTSFDVRKYSTDSAVQVAITEGRVALAACGHNTTQCATVPSAMLAAGDLAMVSERGIESVRHGVDVSALTTWTSGDLRFRDAPVSDVAAALSRWYDLDVDASDPALAGRVVTLSVGQHTPDEIIAAVADAGHAHVVRAGRRVILTSNPQD